MPAARLGSFTTSNFQESKRLLCGGGGGKIDSNLSASTTFDKEHDEPEC